MKLILRDQMQDFLDDCQQKGHSRNTLGAYRNALWKFTEYAAQHGAVNVEDVTRALLRQYAASLSSELSPGGAHARLRPLKTFFTWLEADELIARSPMRRVTLPKLPTQLLPAVGPEEVQRLMRAAGQSRHPLRDRALLAVLYDTGVRVSELCGLQCQELQSGGRLEVKQAKGSRARVVPISRAAVRHVTRYLQDERPESPLGEVFLCHPDAAMNRNTVKQLLERLCKVADIEPVSPHAFRRGFAVNYLRNAGDVFSLQRILGHRSLEMTNRYAVLNTEDLRSMHRQASPLTALQQGRTL